MKSQIIKKETQQQIPQIKLTQKQKILQVGQKKQNNMNKTISQKLIGKNKYKQNQLTIIFILVSFCTILPILQVVLFFQSNKPVDFILWIMYGIIFLKIIVWSISFLQLVELKQFLRLFLLMDPILLTQLSSSISMVFMLYFMGAIKWHHNLLFFFIFLSNHLWATNFRIMILYAGWKPWQVIIQKFCLGGFCTFYIIYGAIFLKRNFSFSIFGDTTYDSIIKSFIVLFIASNFGFGFEMFAKLSDFDKTGDLKSDYQIVLEQKIQQESIVSSGYQNQYINHDRIGQISLKIRNYQ